MRWFRSGVTEEERAAFSPLGDLIGFRSVLKEDAPGARLSREEARALALRFLATRGLPEASLQADRGDAGRAAEPDGLELRGREGGREARRRHDPLRDDRLGRPGHGLPRVRPRPGGLGAGLRPAALEEQRGGPGRDGRPHRDASSRCSAFSSRKIARKDVPWRLVAAFGGIGFVLSLLSVANDLPLTLFGYDTASSASVLPDEPDRPRPARGDRHGRGDRPGGRRGRAHLPGALPGEDLARGRLLVPGHPVEGVPEERRPGLRAGGVLLRLPGRVLRRGGALRRVGAGRRAVQRHAQHGAALGDGAPDRVPAGGLRRGHQPDVLDLVPRQARRRPFRRGGGAGVHLGIRALDVSEPALLHPGPRGGVRGSPDRLPDAALRRRPAARLALHGRRDLHGARCCCARATRTTSSRERSPRGSCCSRSSSPSCSMPGGAAFSPAAGLSNGDVGFVPAPAPAFAAGPIAAVPVRPLSRRALVGMGVLALLLASSLVIPGDRVEADAEDSTGRPAAEAIAHRFLEVNGGDRGRMAARHLHGHRLLGGRGRSGGEAPGRGRHPRLLRARPRKYVIEKGGPAAFQRLSERQLPLAYWVVRYFQPEKKEEWKVLLDARRSRVVAFVHPIAEDAPASSPPSAEAAQRRALDAAGKLGYPAAAYAVLNVGTEARPKRVDTTVVLEANPGGIGDARPRLTAVFHGGQLAAFLPTIHVPEDFLREQRSRSSGDWILLAVRIVAMGALVGVAIILFLRRVRQPGFRWTEVRRPLLWTALVAAAGLANALPAVFRRYTTETPMSLFRLGVAVSMAAGLAVTLLGALVGFVLVSGARPGWAAGPAAGRDAAGRGPPRGDRLGGPPRAQPLGARDRLAGAVALRPGPDPSGQPRIRASGARGPLGGGAGDVPPRRRRFRRGARPRGPTSSARRREESSARSRCSSRCCRRASTRLPCSPPTCCPRSSSPRGSRRPRPCFSATMPRPGLCSGSSPSVAGRSCRCSRSRRPSTGWPAGRPRRSSPRPRGCCSVGRRASDVVPPHHDPLPPAGGEGGDLTTPSSGIA